MPLSNRKQPLCESRYPTITVAVILLLFVAVGCSRIAQPTPPSEFEAETDDRSILEGNTEIKFPRSATDIHGYVGGFRDVDTYARFSIPTNDLNEFIGSIGCHLPLDTTDIRSQMQDSLTFEWWKPIDAQAFQWCIVETENLSRQVFFDMTGQESVIVYILATTK